MKQWILGAALATALLVPASAVAESPGTPTHVFDSFSGTFVSSAGDRCDFPYQISYTVDVNAVVYGDPDDPTRIVEHDTAHVTHTNLDTGYALTEVDHGTFFYDAASDSGKAAGLNWHLRTPDGKIVFIQAGEITFAGGVDVKVTPHMSADATEIVCAALGGSAA
jgi:hypothetical protein